MPAPLSFDYAMIRVVPRVERGEFINVGVLVFCRPRRFLEARLELDPERLSALWPGIDIDELRQHLSAISLICAGGEAGGPIGELPQAERFHWLVAPRSTVIQTSPVHCGLASDPAQALEALMDTMVRLPERLPRAAQESDVGGGGSIGR